MPIQCPRCQMVNRDSAQYCDSCGANLTEHLSSPLPIDTKSVSQVAKPVSLPEKPFYPSISPSASQEPDKFPRVKAGPHFGAWLLFIIIFIIVHFGIFALLVELLNGLYEEFEVFLLQGFIIFLIGLFIFLRIAKAKVFTGLVTHIEPYIQQKAKPNKKSDPNLVLNLQQTNRQWSPLKDYQGYLQPVLEITFRSGLVHGAPLEEGARIVIKGKKRGNHYQALEIWNLSTKNQPAMASQASKYWGRVIYKEPPRNIPDLRYPGQAKIIEIWEFRLQSAGPNFDQLSRDANGDLLVPIPVEIRARTISGSLQDGDKVEINGLMVNGTLYVNQLINHSAGGAGLVIKEIVGIP